MSSKKKNIFNIGLIGLATIPIATTISSTTGGTKTNLKVEKIWNLKDPSKITQEDVVNLLNITRYKDETINLEKWKIELKAVGNESFSKKLSFPNDYTIPKTVSQIGPNAFAGISFPENFEIPKTISEIGDYAFRNAILSKGFKFVPTVTTIKEGTFDNATIYSKMDVPSSVTKIGKYAFRNTIFHKLLLIRKSVLSIGKKVFHKAIFNSDFHFLPDLEKIAPKISSDFLEGAKFKKTRLFLLPFKEIPSEIFNGVTFIGGKKEVVIENGHGFFIEKLNDLTGINKNTFDSLKIPGTILKIEKQSILSDKISNELYEQVKKNIILDVLRKFAKEISGDSFNKNLRIIINKSKNKLPSLAMENIKKEISKILSSIIASNFSGNKPNYLIGDKNLEKIIIKNGPLENVEKFFDKNLISIIPNDENGNLIFNLKFQLMVDGNETNLKWKKTIKNFKRSNIDSDIAKIDKVILLFNSLKRIDSILARKNTFLPSSLAKEVTAKNLGFIDPTLGKREGTDVSFNVKKHDNKNGELIIEVIVKKSNKEKRIEFILKGFQTASQALAARQSDLSALKAYLAKGKVVRENDKATDIANRINNEKSLKDELGIDLSVLKQTSSYLVNNAIGNSNGEIVVNIMIRTPGFRRMLVSSSPIKHKSDLLLAKEANNRKIVAIKNILDILDDTNSSLKNRATTLASSVTTTPEGIGFTLPPLNGTSISYVYNVDDVNGKIIVTATISKGTGTPATSIFSIKGFQTTAQAQRIIDQDIINGITIKNITLPNPTNNALPNTILKPGVQKIKEATITFTKWEPNNNEGKITWEVTITKGAGTTFKKINGVLEGYQTTRQRGIANALQATNLSALQGLLKNGVVVQTRDTARTIANRINNAKTLNDELGIDLTSLPSSSTYDIAAVGNASGQVTINVTTRTPKATTLLSRIQTLVVKHKSDLLLAKEANNRKIVAIKNILDILDDTNSSLKNRATTLASSVTTTPEGIGFTLPPLNGTSISYVYNVDDVNGKIIVTATISKGTGTPATSIFSIKGFQTTAQAQRIIDQDIINGITIKNITLPNPTNNALPNTILKPGVQKIKEATITFTKWEPNNNEGKITWEVTITKGAGTTFKKINGVLEGYQTTRQRGIANALQATNLSALQGLLKNGVVVQTRDTARTIANRINNAKTLNDELGIDLTSLPSSSTYDIAAVGNASGKVTINVTTRTPKATTLLSRIQTLVVKHKSDLLLAKEANNRKIVAIKNILDILDDTNSSLKNRATTLASSVTTTPEGIGFTLPPLNGTSISYVYNVDDVNGKIIVTATISKGTGTPATSIFSIKGFQTTAQAQRIIDQDIINGITIKNITLPNPTNNALPNTILKPGVQKIKEATITFTKWEPNNNEGKITWEVTITKGAGTTFKKINGVLNGYQDKARYDIITSKNLISNLNNSLTTRTNIFASYLDWTLFNPGPDDYGFTQPIFPEGVNVYYLFKGSNDEKGEAIIEATISSGLNNEKVNFILKGFKTQKILDLESLEERIRNIVWVKSFLGSNTSQKIKKETINEISSIDNAAFNKDSLQSLSDNATFPSDIMGASLTYSHNGIKTDGTLTVNVKIVKNGEEMNASFNVDIVGINKAKEDRRHINAAQTAINNIPDLDFEVNDIKLRDVKKEDKVIFNQDVFTKFGGGNLPTLPNGLTLNYYYPKVNEDGKQIVSVEISKGKVSSKIATFNINFIGINRAKDLKKAKDLINNIPDLNLKVNKDKINSIIKSDNQIFNQAVFKNLGGNVLPNLPNKLVLKYSHPELNKNGELVVTIYMSKEKISDSASFVVVVTGIDEFKKNESRKLITINQIKKINNFTFSHKKQKMPSEVSELIQNHVTLEAFTGIKLPVTPKDNEKIKIVAKHDDAKGKLKLKIKVIPHGTKEENAEEIEKEVLGLTTKKQRDEQIKSANRVIEKVKNQIKKDLHQKVVWNNFKNKYPSSLENETSPMKIGFNSFNAPNGVEVTYELIKSDDAKGKAKVRATIKKEYGRSQFTDFNLHGYKKGVGKFSRIAITLISIGGVSIFGILILFFKNLFKKSTKKIK